MAGRPSGTTRRGALRSGGMLAALAGAGLLPRALGAPAPSRPTIRELHAALVAANAVARAVEAEDDSVDPDGHEQRMDAACDAWWEVAWQLPATPARDQAELQMKADALRIVLEFTVCIDVGQTIADLERTDGVEIENVLAWSLARDVLAEPV